MNNFPGEKIDSFCAIGKNGKVFILLNH